MLEHKIAVEAGALVVCVDLPPNMESMAGVDLDVSPRLLRLTTPAPHASLTTVDLPHTVDADSTKAKFSKKRRTLTVTCTLAT